MTKAPAWFDITARNAERSRRFYGELFDWEIAVDESMNYGLTSTADGVPGGIGETGDGSPHPAGVVLYFPVEDLDGAVARAERLGGSIAVPAWELPGLGRMAVILDVDGNRIGLWQR
ncbi:hypothetical protein EV193_102645 [Herbihabitans rhizosphaerae]|uniref:VOC domain-containing protein n=1 Tax=Herbihabitans rhizosphaerae TaxID=1872711 RepID=A0A4Q7L3B1_9PSEU|nr:VOC family protein [Herbihabitans rhizosphaerae]RZS43664.1 hypothetical protein EV193_102645 [Herbihabitans rhizosphaerae]